MSNENILLPYKLGFVAVTTAMIITSTDVHDYYIPTKQFRQTANTMIGGSWESFEPGTYTQISELSDELMEQIDILNTFAVQIIDNSESLKPEAINMINKRFWDLLA